MTLFLRPHGLFGDIVDDRAQINSLCFGQSFDAGHPHGADIGSEHSKRFLDDGNVGSVQILGAKCLEAGNVIDECAGCGVVAIFQRLVNSMRALREDVDETRGEAAGSHRVEGGRPAFCETADPYRRRIFRRANHLSKKHQISGGELDAGDVRMQCKLAEIGNRKSVAPHISDDRNCSGFCELKEIFGLEAWASERVHRVVSHDGVGTFGDCVAGQGLRFCE